jgi:hypothetical protein
VITNGLGRKLHKARVYKFRAPGRRGEFSTVAHNICGSIMELILVTFLAPNIFRWLINFWIICAPLTQRVGKAENLNAICNTWSLRLKKIFPPYFIAVPRKK